MVSYLNLYMYVECTHFIYQKKYNKKEYANGRNNESDIPC